MYLYTARSITRTDVNHSSDQTKDNRSADLSNSACRSAISVCSSCFCFRFASRSISIKFRSPIVCDTVNECYSQIVIIPSTSLVQYIALAHWLRQQFPSQSGRTRRFLTHDEHPECADTNRTIQKYRRFFSQFLCVLELFAVQNSNDTIIINWNNFLVHGASVFINKTPLI